MDIKTEWKWYLILILIWNSLKISDIEQLLIKLLYSYMYSWKNIYSGSFLFIAIGSWGFWYILNINHLWNIWFVNISPSSICYLFILLLIFFSVKSSLDLELVILDSGWYKDGMRLNWPDIFCLLPLGSLSCSFTSLTTSLDRFSLCSPETNRRRKQTQRSPAKESLVWMKSPWNLIKSPAISWIPESDISLCHMEQKHY